MTTLPSLQPPPEAAIAAIDRLNVHARAPALFGGQRRAIYAYKAVAAVALGQAGQLEARLVEWRGACSRCDGTGQYWDHDPGWKTRCRNCDGSGSARLRFLETRLADGRTWHHPWTVRGQGFVGWEIARAILGTVEWSDDGTYTVPDAATGAPRTLPWEPAGEWAPQRPGEALAPGELAELLNLVEGWICGLPSGHWTLAVAIEQLTAYRIDLGRIPGPCCLCGSAAVSHGLHIVAHRVGLAAGFVEWSRPCCPAHPGISPDAWPRDLPEAQITPSIREWLANREPTGMIAARLRAAERRHR